MPTKPAKAFGDRWIAFLFTPKKETRGERGGKQGEKPTRHHLHGAVVGGGDGGGAGAKDHALVGRAAQLDGGGQEALQRGGGERRAGQR